MLNYYKSINSALIISLLPFIKAQQLPSRDLIVDDTNPTSANYEMVGSHRFYTKCSLPNTVALTYDDGPSAGLTSRLLEMLKSENVKATFFVLGSMLEEDPENFEALRQVSRDGHSVGSHGYSHKSFLELNQASITEEMRKTESLIQRATGKRPTLFRPPYGDISPSVANQLSALGYTLVRWNFDSRDWEVKNTRVDEQVVQQYTQSGQTYIMLYHDIHSATIDAQKAIIQHLKSLNYKFVTVDECLGNVNPPSNPTHTPGPNPPSKPTHTPSPNPPSKPTHTFNPNPTIHPEPSTISESQQYNNFESSNTYPEDNDDYSESTNSYPEDNYVSTSSVAPYEPTTSAAPYEPTTSAAPYVSTSSSNPYEPTTSATSYEATTSATSYEASTSAAPYEPTTTNSATSTSTTTSCKSSSTPNAYPGVEGTAQTYGSSATHFEPSLLAAFVIASLSLAMI